MEKHLAKALSKHYEKVGNQTIFRTTQGAMNLSQLADELWARLGEKSVYASVMSRVIGGTRLFTARQLEAFCDLVGIEGGARQEIQDAWLQDQIEEFLTKIRGPYIDEEVVTAALSRLQGAGYAPYTFADQPQVFRGAQSVCEAAIALIEAAPELQEPHKAEIIFTFQGGEDLFSLAPEYRHAWRRSLTTGLKRGWDITHLIRLNNDLDRTLDIVTEMLALLGSPGDYVPHYFTPYGTFSPPYDFIIVPTVGALQALATEQVQSVDSAIFVPVSEQFELLSAHVARLSEQTTPLFTSYPLNSMAFDNNLTRIEEHEGTRLLVKDGLSSNTEPLSVLRERIRPTIARGGDEANWAYSYINNRKRRQEAFQKQVQTHQFRDLCSKSAIKRLVQIGQYATDDWLLSYQGGNVETPNQRVQHLQAVIDCLESYPNYELGLLDEEDEHILQSFWEVKEQYAVVFETWPAGSREIESQIDLMITEPTIVSAFSVYFSNIWNSLPAQNTDKQYVLSFLREQVKSIG